MKKLTKADLRRLLVEWLPVLLLVGLALLLTLPLILGLRSYVVLSGSMEPRYPVGSLVYVRTVPQQTLAVGDVITFYGVGDAVVTHRIVACDPAAGTLTTQGDANTTPDPVPVATGSVLGRVVLCLPFVGYLSLLLQSSGGVVVMALVAGGLAVLWLGGSKQLRFKEEADEEA